MQSRVRVPRAARHRIKIHRADRPVNVGDHRRGRDGRHFCPWKPTPPSSSAAAAVVRLVGDDQRLAAIGAGAVVLRDIQASYGAVRLSELHRFTDPAEGRRPRPPRRQIRSARLLPGPATRPRRRPHHHPRRRLQRLAERPQPSLDAIMLAPTRDLSDLVRALNQRARAHRLADNAPGRQVSWPTATGPASAT